MKTKNTALWKWLQSLDNEGLPENYKQIVYIAECLDKNHSADNIFWKVFEKHNLRASCAIDAAAQIYELLPEFED